jgi:ADP-ribose pyrophosphatase YjhB (NUDIX family)
MDHEGDVRVRVGGILTANNEILLIAHKKNNDVYWLLPGGGVDYGESLSEALIREFSEELNIEIAVNDLVLISDSIDPAGDRHIINIFFLCEYSKGEFILGNELRLYDFKFFKKEELPNIKLFPPINDELVSIMNDGAKMKYIGKLWKDG